MVVTVMNACVFLGHCRRGDMESAEGMLAMMEKNGMSPTATSYTALLCGHADRGDMDRVESVSNLPPPPHTHTHFESLLLSLQLLGEMRSHRVFPSMGVYTTIMDHLSAGGHSDMVARALDLVQEKQLMYHGNYGNSALAHLLLHSIHFSLPSPLPLPHPLSPQISMN